jgi:nucleoid-associated protein YgaU
MADTETDIATAPAEDGTLPAPPSAGVSEVLAPKLQSIDSAVIIRRGDTLWRISRRVYGRGVRYSTIYLANQTQIEDPDRIWPGQVFKVPEKSADGEAEADYSTLGNRLTTLPKEGEPAPTEAQQ